MSIRIKRAYVPPSPDDGTRILVDRVWPRGMTREKLNISQWMRDIAPSTQLRKDFCHDPEKWDGFVKSYFAELDGKPELVRRLREFASSGTLALVYGAKDEIFNQAAALKQYLDTQK